MRKEPALTYQGALKILGKHESSAVKALDTLLGGLILAAGPAAYLGRQAAQFLWGAVDQKNEAIGLLNRLVRAGTARLLRTTGRERHELLQAAHTTIVAAALFEALREELGERYKDLDLTRAEQVQLLTGRTTEEVVETLCFAEVPIPSAARGFEENLAALSLYYNRMVLTCQNFFGGLAAGENLRIDLQATFDITARALRRYQSHYLQLAAEVPEFFVWAMLGEQAATRTALRGIGGDLRAALDAQGEGLTRLTALLELLARSAPQPGGQRERLGRANQAALAKPLAPADVLRYVEGLRFPSVGSGYVTPQYRYAVVGDDTRIDDDEWWAGRPEHEDLDAFLAAHFTAPVSSRRPLLILGDPGAGKSMLTKVLAARLPVDGYTVVRVPLRDVTAHDKVRGQVQEALDDLTNGRVRWDVLADESHDIVRVVVFDGLDEVIQTAGTGRNYLRDVMDFQDAEDGQGAPVAAVVTSRTLVTGRTWVPPGCLVVKLSEFTDEQVAQWLTSWRRANADAVAAGQVRTLEVPATHRLPELARQPLLLLLLALYAADPRSPGLGDEQLSSAELYRRLLDNFVRREIDQNRLDIPPHQLDREIADRLWHLGIAALAMFNRGRTFVVEQELDEDLKSLHTNVPEGGARRVIGQFFFIHAASAKVPGHLSRQGTFEFLHNTFCEYLVAATVLEVLGDIASTAPTGRARARAANRLDDDLLHALLSHYPLAVQQPILTFAGQIAAALDEGERAALLDLLTDLLAQVRDRADAGLYAGYRPRSQDPVRELAAYTANLVLLRVHLDWRAAPLTAVAPGGSTALEAWRSTVRMWRAGLDGQSWRAMLEALRLSGDVVFPGLLHGLLMGREDVVEARLLGDQALVRRLLAGYAADPESSYASPWNGMDTHAELVGTLLYGGAFGPALLDAIGVIGLEENLPSNTRQLAVNLLGQVAPDSPYEVVRSAVAVVLPTGLSLEKIDYSPLLVTAAMFPQLDEDLPRLFDVLGAQRWIRGWPARTAVVTIARNREIRERFLALLDDTERFSLPSGE